MPLHSAAAPKPLGDGSEGKLVQEFDSSENLQETMGCWWQAYTEDRVMGRCGGRSHFNRVHRTEKRHERHASHCKSACVAGSSETRPRTRLKKRGRKSPIQCSCVENGSLGISRLQVGATPDKKQRWLQENLHETKNKGPNYLKNKTLNWLLKERAAGCLPCQSWSGRPGAEGSQCLSKSWKLAKA